MNILNILQDSAAKWERERPCNPESVQKLVAASEIVLPDEYLVLLKYSNGGEADLGIGPGWFQLWSAEDILELNESYRVKDNLPGLFGFGSSGGGELLAFDTRSDKPWRIVAVPFVPMMAGDVWIVADDFEAFVRAMGHEWNSI
jgi:hypothetical protein